MANIYTSAEQLVGKTPLLELTHIEKELNLTRGFVYHRYRASFKDVIERRKVKEVFC